MVKADGGGRKVLEQTWSGHAHKPSLNVKHQRRLNKQYRARHKAGLISQRAGPTGRATGDAPRRPDDDLPAVGRADNEARKAHRYSLLCYPSRSGNSRPRSRRKPPRAWGRRTRYINGVRAVSAVFFFCVLFSICPSQPILTYSHQKSLVRSLNGFVFPRHETYD